jgi:hypothetical protein
MTNIKALKLHGDGAFRNIYNNNILPESHSTCQAINRLKKYIQDKQLTNSLEVLEQFGICGDSALLLIGYISKGVANAPNH